MTDFTASNKIVFRSEMLQSRMLLRDARGQFVEKNVPVELRFDPLTGRTCRLVEFSLNRIVRPDFSMASQKSQELGCPFCPGTVEKVIPHFTTDLVPEGTIRQGEAIVFPNAKPYDTHSSVVVVSRKHFVALTEFTREMLMNAFSAAFTYINKVHQVDSRAKHHFIAWNYMPPSGGSVVHSHIQCNAGSFPTPFQKQLLEASEGYFEKNGTNFWSDLIEREKSLGQRYIGTVGSACWLTGFAPKGRLMDVLAVFPGKTSLMELTETDFQSLTDGILRVFRYMDNINVLSFNLSTYSSEDANKFWLHVRITPRSMLYYSPIETSDYFYYQVLQDENILLLSPETACQGLKKYFTD